VTPKSPQGRLHEMAGRNQLARLEAPNPGAARELHDDAAAHARGVDALLGVEDYSGVVLLAYEMARKAALGPCSHRGGGPPEGKASTGSPSRPPGIC